jgi:hypothetical protein
MYLSTRFIIRRMPFQIIFFISVVISMTLYPLLSTADEDPCRETGMYIRNGTTHDMWYRLDDSQCTLWRHEHILILKPGETLFFFEI